MTLILKLDLDMVKMYYHTKNDEVRENDTQTMVTAFNWKTWGNGDSGKSRAIISRLEKSVNFIQNAGILNIFTLEKLRNFKQFLFLFCSVI